MNPIKYLRGGGLSQGASIVCSAFLTVGQSGETTSNLGYNSLNKIAGIIFIARPEIPRNIEPSPFLFAAPILQKHLTYLRCRLGLIILPHNFAHFVSYVLQVSSPITHNLGVHDHDIFISGGIYRATRPSIITNALSLPLQLWYPFFTML